MTSENRETTINDEKAKDVRAQNIVAAKSMYLVLKCYKECYKECFK